MITHVKGRLVEKAPTSVVIESNGIGYLINISLNTFSQIPDNENLKLFTHLSCPESDQSPQIFVELFKLTVSRLPY